MPRAREGTFVRFAKPTVADVTVHSRKTALPGTPEKNFTFLRGPVKTGVRTMFRTPICHAVKLQIAKNLPSV